MYNSLEIDCFLFNQRENYVSYLIKNCFVIDVNKILAWEGKFPLSLVQKISTLMKFQPSMSLSCSFFMKV